MYVSVLPEIFFAYIDLLATGRISLLDLSIIESVHLCMTYVSDMVMLTAVLCLRLFRDSMNTAKFPAENEPTCLFTALNAVMACH